MNSHELLQGLIEATLAGTAAILLVLGLRRVLRRAFGAGVAYGAWLLVPVAMLATLLPATEANVTASAPILRGLVPPLHFVDIAPAVQGGIDPTGWLIGAWMLGAVGLMLVMGRAQRRFRVSLGRLRTEHGLHVAQIARPGLPATVGLLRPQVIMPCDFSTRFSPTQRMLILAHEQAHIRRGDHLANALLAMLRCVFWFNPLLHLAARQFHQDQELACDECVIARYPETRRAYGEALLQTQLMAQLAPIGCHFGFGHPLKERIAMLRHSNPPLTRRAAGAALIALLGCGTAFAVWAAQPDVVPPPPAAPLAQPMPPVPPVPPVPQVPPMRATDFPPPPPPPPLPPSSVVPMPAALQYGSVDSDSRQMNPPRYPADAVKEGKTGVVILVVDIDAHGGVIGTKVERSSGDARLDGAAMDAAAKWRFNPEMKQGRPVAGKVRVPVEFAMDEPVASAAG